MEASAFLLEMSKGCIPVETSIVAIEGSLAKSTYRKAGVWFLAFAHVEAELWIVFALESRYSREIDFEHPSAAIWPVRCDNPVSLCSHINVLLTYFGGRASSGLTPSMSILVVWLRLLMSSVPPLTTG